MKLILLLTLLIFSFPSFSQDKIIFDDGRTKTVKILNINESTGTIEYTVRDKNGSFPLATIVEYRHNDVWYTYDFDTKTFEKSETATYKTFPTEFRSNPKFVYGRFSVGLSFGIPIKPGSRRRLLRNYFAINPRISVEPEYRVNNWFSLKVPLVYGLGVKGEGEESFVVANSYANNEGTYVFTNDQQEHRGVLSYKSFNNATLPTYNDQGNNYYAFSEVDLHTKELIFQGGLAAKFYPLGHGRLSVFLSPGISYGIGNYNAVDYYANFEQETILNYLGDPVDVWKLTGENLISKPGKFSYWRAELLAGMDFDLMRNFNFSVEMGVSSNSIAPKVREDDHVYISINNGTPVLSNTAKFYAAGLTSEMFIVRFLLVYKFGGQKI